MTQKLLFILSTLILTISSCKMGIEDVKPIQKFSPSDPFADVMMESQYFDLDATNDTVLRGTIGTTIALPNGCFINKKGDVVTNNVQIELAEALSLEEMLISNLTTTADGQLLETDGMIYLNATSDGEQLKVNPKNPIYIEIPTEDRKGGMMAYKGMRNDNGNMNWVDPVELDNFLIPVDLALLEFLPNGFAEAVHQGMPFRNHQTANQELTESLYYSFAEYFAEYIDFNLDENMDGEPIDFGPIGDPPLDYDLEDEIPVASEVIMEEGVDSTSSLKGIDPAKIKAIKSLLFQNTLISTREFETRLQVIFQTCDDKVLEFYISNLDKNLYEIDLMVANYLAVHINTSDFIDFADQGLTNLEDVPNVKLLHEYYNKNLKEIKEELIKLKKEAEKAIEEKRQIAEETNKGYKDLLEKRDGFRKQAYGFTYTDLGWINIDRGTAEKNWGPAPLAVTVENADAFESVYTYVVYTTIKSLIRLDSDDDLLNMPKKARAIVASIAYKDGQPYFAKQEFETFTDTELSLVLTMSTMDEIKSQLKEFDNYAQENSITNDLEFMKKLGEKMEFEYQIRAEEKFMGRLYDFAFPCNDYLFIEPDYPLE